jgi:hypothetical protein
MEINLDEILEQPTQKRSETVSQPTDTTTEITDFSGLEFEPLPAKPEPVAAVDENGIEVDLSYNAEQNAEGFVDLLDFANTATLTPLAKWRLQRKQGGKQAIREMQLIAEKKYNKEKLTDDENRQFERYNAYLKDKEDLLEAIPYTKDEKKALVRSATAYFEKTKIKVENMAFWGELLIIQGQRIALILTA